MEQQIKTQRSGTRNCSNKVMMLTSHIYILLLCLHITISLHLISSSSPSLLVTTIFDIFSCDVYLLYLDEAINRYFSSSSCDWWLLHFYLLHRQLWWQLSSPDESVMRWGKLCQLWLKTSPLLPSTSWQLLSLIRCYYHQLHHFLLTQMRLMVTIILKSWDCDGVCLPSSHETVLLTDFIRCTLSFIIR